MLRTLSPRPCAASALRRLSTLAHPPRHRVAVDAAGTEMAYVDVSESSGAPIVFLHGNPTSSYLWRDVMPHCFGAGRCLAPDLVGMGSSAKAPDGQYRFADHARYLDEWFDALGLEDVTLVLHDWGSALGFDWANRNRARVRAIAHMESLTAPVDGWAGFPGSGRKIFSALWSDAGEEMVLQKNMFVERILPASIMRTLEPHEMEAYRAPFAAAGEARRPTLTWPRNIPIVGAEGAHAHEAAEVIARVRAYAAWLAESDGLPKLYLHAQPGFFAETLCWPTCKDWPDQRRVDVKGLHFCQEDSPDEIGRSVADFVRALP